MAIKREINDLQSESEIRTEINNKIASLERNIANLSQQSHAHFESYNQLSNQANYQRTLKSHYIDILEGWDALKDMRDSNDD